MKKEDDKKGPWILFGSIIIVFVLSAIIILVSFSNWTDRGAFGDMFGAVNALFSALAFGGVIYAILLQRKELSLQREELELTRKELEKSADAQKKSSLLLEKQVKLMEETRVDQLAKERKEAEPVISLMKGTPYASGKKIVFTVRNSGGIIYYPKVEAIEKDFQISVDTLNNIPTDGQAQITIISDKGHFDDHGFILRFQNSYKEEREMRFNFQYRKGLFPLSDG